jgi:RecA-family ATPase
MRLTDHVILNFNNNMSTAAVFLDIEKDFDTTWHTDLLYKLSKFDFSVSLINIISSFLYKRKLFVSVEGEMSTPRIMKAESKGATRIRPVSYTV